VNRDLNSRVEFIKVYFADQSAQESRRLNSGQLSAVMDAFARSR